MVDPVEFDRPASFSLTTLAREFECSRETIRRRLDEAGVEPCGDSGGYPLYRLRDALRAWLQGRECAIDPSSMQPMDRKAHYDAELKALQLQTLQREVIPRVESEQEQARNNRITSLMFDTMTDVLERDCGLSGEALARVERSIDECREALFKQLIEEEAEAIA